MAGTLHVLTDYSPHVRPARPTRKWMGDIFGSANGHADPALMAISKTANLATWSSAGVISHSTNVPS